MVACCRSHAWVKTPSLMFIFRMMKLWRRLLGVALLTLLAGACSPALDWRQLTLDDASGLTGQFPCKPEQHERTVRPTGADEALRVTMWSCSASGMNWALSRVQVAQPDAVPRTLAAWPRWTQANLEAASQALPQPSAPQVQDLGELVVPGMTPWPQARAWRMRAERPNAAGQPMPVAVTSWHFAHGLAVYQAAVWRTGADANATNGDDVMNAFFQGFQFRP